MSIDNHVRNYLGQSRAFAAKIAFSGLDVKNGYIKSMASIL